MPKLYPVYLRIVSSFCVTFIAVTCTVYSAQGRPQPLDPATGQAGVEETLRQALKRRREYVEAFKNLTAEETKLTEVFDNGGRLEKQRKQTAYFVVYQSQLNNEVVSEYRFILEVDGKAVHNQFDRADKLFSRLARSKTLEKEWKRLSQENLRYRLKYYRWDLTLHPAGQLEQKAWPLYSYEILGREKLDNRETIVLSYRRNSLYPVKAGGILAGFKDPQVGDQGRLWLDSDSFQIRRWENEWVVRHRETGKMVVYIRDEVDYVESDLGILVPDRIVVSFFDKLRYGLKDSVGPHAVLGGRITYSYGAFKRFEVTSQEHVERIKNN